MTIKNLKIYLGSLDRELLLIELSNWENHYKWILDTDSCLTSKITIDELLHTSKCITACITAIKNY